MFLVKLALSTDRSVLGTLNQSRSDFDHFIFDYRNIVATVLAELAEKIDIKRLIEVADQSPVAWVQRYQVEQDLVICRALVEIFNHRSKIRPFGKECSLHIKSDGEQSGLCVL